MIYTVTSKQDITDIKAEIEAKAKEAGFGILNSYDFKQILENKRISYQEGYHRL